MDFLGKGRKWLMMTQDHRRRRQLLSSPSLFNDDSGLPPLATVRISALIECNQLRPNSGKNKREREREREREKKMSDGSWQSSSISLSSSWHAKLCSTATIGSQRANTKRLSKSDDPLSLSLSQHLFLPPPSSLSCTSTRVLELQSFSSLSLTKVHTTRKRKGQSAVGTDHFSFSLFSLKGKLRAEGEQWQKADKLLAQTQNRSGKSSGGAGGGDAKYKNKPAETKRCRLADRLAEHTAAAAKVQSKLKVQIKCGGVVAAAPAWWQVPEEEEVEAAAAKRRHSTILSVGLWESLPAPTLWHTHTHTVALKCRRCRSIDLPTHSLSLWLTSFCLFSFTDREKSLTWLPEKRGPPGFRIDSASWVVVMMQTRAFF